MLGCDCETFRCFSTADDYCVLFVEVNVCAWAYDLQRGVELVGRLILYGVLKGNLLREEINERIHKPDMRVVWWLSCSECYALLLHAVNFARLKEQLGLFLAVLFRVTRTNIEI